MLEHVCESAKFGDMLSLTMGFGTEAYATMLYRLNETMTTGQIEESMRMREDSLKGLHKYFRRTNERLNEGANVWIGEVPVELPTEA